MRKYMSLIPSSLLYLFPVKIMRCYFQNIVNNRHTEAHSDLTPDKQLLVDVSVIIKSDARTGIQRVVRALLLQLFSQQPSGYCVRPVFATRKHGYYYAPDDFNLSGKQLENLASASPVSVGQGDIFLGLDLAAHLLSLHKIELAEWKHAGVKIHIIVYDLLPVLHPHWFNPKTTRNFQRWLKTIAIFSDSLISISNSVKKEINNWFDQHYGLTIGQIPVNVIPLGADIQASAPSRGLPHNIGQLLNNFLIKETVLIVGTVEPRKGHQQVLAAFEKLWEQKHAINLVIVGKAGWKTEALQAALRHHPENQNHLYWFDNASDELLELLYKQCTGVIVASLAEGFGLPLIEAMYYQKPVLARNIDVFREIAGNNSTFFSGVCSQHFADEIKAWLKAIKNTQDPANLPLQIWQDSIHTLLTYLELQNSGIALSRNDDSYMVSEVIA